MPQPEPRPMPQPEPQLMSQPEPQPMPQPEPRPMLPASIHLIVYHRDANQHFMSLSISRSHTIRIGKRSSSQKPVDIDLKGRFKSQVNENKCSRTQAEIFYTGKQLFLKNVGSHRLYNESNTEIFPGTDYQLSVGSKIVFGNEIIVEIMAGDAI